MNEFNALNVQFLHKQFCLVIQWQLQKELGRNLTGYPLQYANNKKEKPVHILKCS
jgi:hypothetical protein